MGGQTARRILERTCKITTGAGRWLRVQRYHGPIPGRIARQFQDHCPRHRGGGVAISTFAVDRPIVAVPPVLHACDLAASRWLFQIVSSSARHAQGGTSPCKATHRHRKVTFFGCKATLPRARRRIFAQGDLFRPGLCNMRSMSCSASPANRSQPALASVAERALRYTSRPSRFSSSRLIPSP